MDKGDNDLPSRYYTVYYSSIPIGKRSLKQSTKLFSEKLKNEVVVMNRVITSDKVSGAEYFYHQLLLMATPSAVRTIFTIYSFNSTRLVNTE